MSFYTKVKDYRIRDDKKREVMKLVIENFKGTNKYDGLKNKLLNNKSMSWNRWSRYFDDDYLFDILEETNKEDEDNLGI